MRMANTGVTLLIYAGAALFEIAGCYAFWAVWRLDRPAWWLAPGVVSLLLFAALLTRIDTAFADGPMPPMAAYILSHLLFGCGASKSKPDIWDLTGAGLCLAGALAILLGNMAPHTEHAGADTALRWTTSYK